jgi:hypothetical protein
MKDLDIHSSPTYKGIYMEERVYSSSMPKQTNVDSELNEIWNCPTNCTISMSLQNKLQNMYRLKRYEKI